jgi:hypothetical protein
MRACGYFLTHPKTTRVRDCQFAWRISVGKLVIAWMPSRMLRQFVTDSVNVMNDGKIEASLLAFRFAYVSGEQRH